MDNKRVIIVADDLTGANDTAIQFVNQGLSALVLTDKQASHPAAYEPYDVLALNSNSRVMKAHEAYQTIKETILRFNSAFGESIFYKKIDSVLRGNPAEELAAVMDVLNVPLVLVVPSFPANQSILEQGFLNSGSARIEAVKLFAKGMDYLVESLPLEEIRLGCESVIRYILSRHQQGVRVFVADAVTGDDLETIYQSSIGLKKLVLLAGSAALASHLARDLAREHGNTAPQKREQPGLKSPILIIAGTRQGETAAQISALARNLPVQVVRFNVSLASQGQIEKAIDDSFFEAAEQMKKNGDLCIVAVDSLFSSKIPSGDVDRDEAGVSDEGSAISAALGILSEKLLHSFHFPVLLTTGGDTTLEVCKRLKITGIQPIEELCPGVPMGKIIGGPNAGSFILTKSGRFGSEETLLEILQYFGVGVHEQ